MRLGGRYVAFMHTVLRRGGKSLYSVAAYAFSTSPPFAIEAMSPPFSPDGHATPYPMGLIATGKRLLLSYGVADREWYVAEIDKQRLLRSLVPVRTAPPSAQDDVSPTGAADEGTPLSTQLHFFRGCPDAVREEAVSGMRTTEVTH